MITTLIGVIAGGALAMSGMQLAQSGRQRKLLKGLGQRLDSLEGAQAALIRREEVEAAFQEVARLEAQKVDAARTAAQAAQAMRPPMPQAGPQVMPQVMPLEMLQAMGVMGPQAAPRGAAELNTRINEQLAALNARLGDLGEQFGRY